MSILPSRIEVIDERTAEVYRRMQPHERVERGLQMNAFARGVIEANVRRVHPEWTDERVKAEVRRRFAGD